MRHDLLSDPWVLCQTQLILSSFERWLKKPLLPQASSDPGDLAVRLYHAPFCVLSSDASAHDPLLNYGNALALKLWECDWDELRTTRGRDTAEPINQKDRQRFLTSVKLQGFSDRYEGVRISRKGSRFRIKNAIIWNLIDGNGQYAGQAAMIPEWEQL